ncbi:MAG: hypothetical protein HZA77_11685 [Candidatus Schekmanbacteria bacterium]|nr:hypothetical protein [Candidatus Schekmanbacteria bacterium]
MDNSEYDKTKENMRQALDETYTQVDRSEKKVFEFRSDANDMLEVLNQKKELINRMRLVVNNLPNSNAFSMTRDISDAIESGSRLITGLRDHSNNQYKSIENIAERIDLFSGTLVVGNSSARSADSTVCYIGKVISDVCPAMNNILTTYIQPTASENRNNIEEWLKKIEPLLEQKFKEAFQNMIDKKFMSAAHAMRETLSHLEMCLAPDEKVNKMSWYIPETSTNKPTQKQRIKYAVIGDNSHDNFNEFDLDAIERLMDEGRDIYNKLSGEGHRREGTWEEEKVNNYLSIGENVIRAIMELRERFYVEHE